MIGFAASFAFVSASLVNPLSGAYASTPGSTVDAVGPLAAYRPAGQTYSAASASGSSTARDAYTVNYSAPQPPPVAAPSPTKAAASQGGAAAPVAGTPNPGSAQAVGAELVAARGWGADQYSCLVSLWNKESGWNVYAASRSGAYGIPQALPGSKMASIGADWQTNPATQITWGLNYIQGRYGTPCGAWSHSVASNWY